MLVLLDVDGTLTATKGVDGEVYARSFHTVFGVALPTTDWAAYACGATDRGIADEALRQLGLDSRRVAEFERHFLGELRRELRRRGAQPVPGARTILERLTMAGHTIALATGGWEESARAKVAAAAIDVGPYVLVGSGFAASREEILREARRRSGASERAVYVGDGRWDVQAARALHLPFIGVDAERTGVLRRAGIRHIVEDYLDLAGFERELS